MKEEKTINLINEYRERIKPYYDIKKAVVLADELRTGLEVNALWLKSELDKLTKDDMKLINIHKELLGESYIYNNLEGSIEVIIYDCVRYRYFNKVGDLADWRPGLKRKKDMRLMEYRCNDVYITVNKGNYKYKMSCTDRGLNERGSIEGVL